ncbi:Pimeloyl-[acyl-carrier protein] methyl ester esterase BioH [hydrothermal vent metagenome]|uniref:Pimeloyl-[acyl-carrier protein] methyl ester esterase BioH n=1 Tax=hydrothermal vent metagenome TaxID=652676 RepID=A0A3B0ZSK3_9ZZZZ
MLTVNESGEGSPLVLLHGWGLHSGVWQSILPELDKLFHCYTVDMLGHGESQASSNVSFSLNNMRKALHTLINSIESDNIILVGWSLGGLVAMDYLNHFPSKIKKLILITANACFCKQSDWPHGLETTVLDSFAQQLEHDYKKTVDKFMALQMLGADDYKFSLKVLKSSIASRPDPSMQALRSGLNILKTTDLREKLHALSQPTLMISGEHDRLMPYQAAAAMQVLFSHAKSTMIKGAGHAPFISHPNEFIQLIKEFSYG